MDQKIQRQTRISVDIPVTITTVLYSTEASIVDLTSDGALISGCSLPAGTRFQLDYMGQTLFVQCRWSEVDRMGIRFTFALVDGPLYERLLVARSTQMPAPSGREMPAAYTPSPSAMPARSFERAPLLAGFGRRAG